MIIGQTQTLVPEAFLKNSINFQTLKFFLIAYINEQSMKAEISRKKNSSILGLNSHWINCRFFGIEMIRVCRTGAVLPIVRDPSLQLICQFKFLMKFLKEASM